MWFSSVQMLEPVSTASSHGRTHRKQSRNCQGSVSGCLCASLELRAGRHSLGVLLAGVQLQAVGCEGGGPAQMGRGERSRVFPRGDLHRQARWVLRSLEVDAPSWVQKVPAAPTEWSICCCERGPGRLSGPPLVRTGVCPLWCYPCPRETHIPVVPACCWAWEDLGC